MKLIHLTLRNWRNFKNVDLDIASRLIIVGPNASGKSNLLDSLRFLRDIALVSGGLQSAVAERGGLSRVRCLSARNFNYGRVGVRAEFLDGEEHWTYDLNFKAERHGRHRPVVSTEVVTLNGKKLLDRPDDDDEEDRERLTQTALEQVNANKSFRQIADFMSRVRYLHLVPQVIRDPERAGDKTDDPFGGDFLLRVAETPDATRRSRLKKVNEALQLAVPQLDQLELKRDVSGRPHLEARYQHWRVAGARQDEKDFSDGTLRLIGLLWALLEVRSKGSRITLLEEPELSLHSSIVRQLPSILARVTRKGQGQVILSTHAMDMLADPGLGLDEIVVLKPGEEGTSAVPASQIENIKDLLDAGMGFDEILEPVTKPSGAEELSLFQ
jgi:predicted ATPase